MISIHLRPGWRALELVSTGMRAHTRRRGCAILTEGVLLEVRG